jgi:hypothetical protein
VRGSSERGQTTVEWVGLVTLVSLLLAAVLVAGPPVPGGALARSIASRILCAAALADECGDEPALIAAYGDEVGRLARRHMPTIAFEDGSRAVPVDFRRCRSTSCGDGRAQGQVWRSGANLRVTAFVHVVDCRAGHAADTEAAGADCSGERAGNLYLEYFTYYADSATLRGIPIAGDEGYHPDDWEGVEIRIGADGDVDERASSHNGYNYSLDDANQSSDMGMGLLKGLDELAGFRPENGWGPETHLLLVSGGSHAGNAAGEARGSRYTPARRVHLVPLEPIAAHDAGYRFSISAPWRKRLWTDPEADRTN